MSPLPLSTQILLELYLSSYLEFSLAEQHQQILTGMSQEELMDIWVQFFGKRPPPEHLTGEILKEQLIFIIDVDFLLVVNLARQGLLDELECDLDTVERVYWDYVTLSYKNGRMFYSPQSELWRLEKIVDYLLKLDMDEQAREQFLQKNADVAHYIHERKVSRSG